MRDLNEFTPRERQIVALIAEGYDARQIGEALGLSYRTVHSHIARMRLKANARTRAQMVHVAHQRGYLSGA